MSRLPSCTATQVIRALKRGGFAFDHATGSQHAYWHPAQRRTVVVPFHRGDLKRGTLTGIIRQAGLTVDEFLDLLQP